MLVITHKKLIFTITMMMMNSINIKTLNIFVINVNSLISIEKRLYFTQFLEIHEPDFVFVNETKLNENHNLNFENYNCIRTDRKVGSKGGGTAIIINKKFKFNIISKNNISKYKCLETTIINIKLLNNKNIVLISAYASENYRECFNVEFDYLFKELELGKLENYYILAGDLNAKHNNWGNTENNVRGNFIKNWINNNDIQYKCKLVSSKLPTFRSGSYLDIGIIDVRLKLNIAANNLESFDYDSDHSGIIIRVQNEEETFLMEAEPKKFLINYNKTNWDKFRIAAKKN